MDNRVVWSLPKVRYAALGEIEEARPVALITDKASWARVSGQLNLPILVQAEPEASTRSLLDELAQNVPARVEVIYAVGTAAQIKAGKIVAHTNNLPLVIVPVALDTDQILEPHVELIENGVMSRVVTGAATDVIIDMNVILATPRDKRAGMLADMLSIVTGLLDWRYAVQQQKAPPEHQFNSWAANIATGVARQSIKIAPAIGEGNEEAFRNLLDLTAVSVQLANQLGHFRHQEGTEHYLAGSLENQGVTNLTHAELLAPGIMLTSALHGQDVAVLRDGLMKAGIPIDKLRAADLRLALDDLPNFVAINGLPHAMAHDLDPVSDKVTQALETAGYREDDTGGWQFTAPDPGASSAGDTGAASVQGVSEQS